MTRFELLGLFYRLDLAWAPNQVTFRSKSSALTFLEAAPGWTVRYIPKGGDDK